MEQFNLEEFLKDKNRKVVTRDGRLVRIICTDRKARAGNIVGLVGEDESFIYVWNNDGKHIVSEIPDNDLFFAEEEEELTEFESGLFSLVSEFWQKYALLKEEVDIAELVKDNSKILLDLARKEIEKEITKEVEQKAINHTYAYQNGYENGKYDTLKDLPKFKKIPQGTSRKDLFDMMHKHIVLAFNDCIDYYYLDESDLRKLPKEE